MINFELAFPQGANKPDAFTWRRNFLDGYQIKGLLKEIEKLEYAEKAQTLENKNGVVAKQFDPSIRSSKVKWLEKLPQFKLLYERIAEQTMIANNENWNFDLHSIVENIQYTEYHAKDKGHYDWHADLGPGFASLRKISITINLSDPKDYEGGTLEFNLGGKTKTFGPKEKGAIVLFPSYMLHRVQPVTKGVRKSLVLWIGGKPFR
tara:strand:+ start:2376 stop:2993 length:618 start_codon:yes stop_codon:yes gene_type:complete